MKRNSKIDLLLFAVLGLLFLLGITYSKSILIHVDNGVDVDESEALILQSESVVDEKLMGKQYDYKLIKKDWPIEDYRQEYISYAYVLGGMELVTLIECENAQRTQDRKALGKEESYGFCQINKKWHKDIVEDNRFWTDWKWQIEKCYELMKGGTKFYGRGSLINGKRCDEVIEYRFESSDKN